jgi:hypothetical protein
VYRVVYFEGERRIGLYDEREESKGWVRLNVGRGVGHDVGLNCQRRLKRGDWRRKEPGMSGRWPQEGQHETRLCDSIGRADVADARPCGESS